MRSMVTAYGGWYVSGKLLGRTHLSPGQMKTFNRILPLAKLIEHIAALMEEKKLPFLADIRDESTEDVRFVLEPKSRTVEADQLMEQLFRATDLENMFHGLWGLQ